MIAIFKIESGNCKHAKFISMYGEEISNRIFACNLDVERINQIIYKLSSGNIHGKIVKFTKHSPIAKIDVF